MHEIQKIFDIRKKTKYDKIFYDLDKLLSSKSKPEQGLSIGILKELNTIYEIKNGGRVKMKKAKKTKTLKIKKYIKSTKKIKTSKRSKSKERKQSKQSKQSKKRSKQSKDRSDSGDSGESDRSDSGESDCSDSVDVEHDSKINIDEDELVASFDVKDKKLDLDILSMYNKNIMCTPKMLFDNIHAEFIASGQNLVYPYVLTHYVFKGIYKMCIDYYKTIHTGAVDTYINQLIYVHAYSNSVKFIKLMNGINNSNFEFKSDNTVLINTCEGYKMTCLPTLFTIVN